MTEAERKSFITYTSSRGPGKRQVKPTPAVLDLVLPAAEDEEDDEDFVADHEVGSNEDSDSDEGESHDDSTSSIDDEDEEEIGYIDAAGNFREDVALGPSIHKGDADRLPICALCLNLSNASPEELMKCDKCGVTVHETCYPSLDVSEDGDSSNSSSSMEPWFCEPCIYGLEEPPYCELCPARYGAMKKSDVGGRWVHLICALYTHGVTFGDIDHLGAISWQEMDHRNFGRKSCNGCADVLEARSGVTTRCEVGLCKHYYHVTCAQRLGLLVDHTENPGRDASQRQDDHHTSVEPRYISCRQHSDREEVRQKAIAAARFLAQEEERLALVGKKVLSEKEECKRLKAREKCEKQFQSLVGVTICLPEAFHDKPEKKLRRARHLTSSPEFFEWFQEKAEISGVEPVQFRQEFTKVSGDSIPFLSPGFSAQFFEYLDNRERFVIAAEERKLNAVVESKSSLKKQLDAQVTKLKLNEQMRETTKSHSEERKKLAISFHRALMRLGAKKIAARCPLSTENPVNGRTSKFLTSSIPSPTRSSGTPPPKLKKEVTIHVCKECGKANDQHLMVGCDSCYEHYHIKCLDPPLEKVPKKVNCEWHCADCCDDSDEGEQGESKIVSQDGARNLRQRRDSLKAKRLAADEEEKRAYKSAIASGIRSSSFNKSPITVKKPAKRRSLGAKSTSTPKRKRLRQVNGLKTNGIPSSRQIAPNQGDQELGEDCFVILDDE